MVTLKILLVFILMVILLRKKINLGIVLIIDSLFLAILFWLSPKKIFDAIIITITSAQTFNLMSILILTLFIENILRKKLYLKKMVDSLKNIIKDYRIAMIMLPPLIGLLPSAGGAVFSAPMVEEVSKHASLLPEDKSIANYWYRHIWEYMFPLYQGIVLTSEILRVSLINIIKILAPFGLFAAFVGIPFIFLKCPKCYFEGEGKNRDKLIYIKQFFYSISPILLIVALIFIAKLNISLSLLITIVFLLIINKYSLEDLKILFKEAFSINIIFLVLGVMFFKNILEISNAVELLPSELVAFGIPNISIIMILPFIAGLLTGISQAFVAIAFPILLGLNITSNPHLIALAYISGFTGVMLSPLHLCLVLTVDYFKASFFNVLRRVALLQGAVFCTALLMYLLIR